jgi:hypothetical protein
MQQGSCFSHNKQEKSLKMKTFTGAIQQDHYPSGEIWDKTNGAIEAKCAQACINEDGLGLI